MQKTVSGPTDVVFRNTVGVGVGVGVGTGVGVGDGAMQAIVSRLKIRTNGSICFANITTLRSTLHPLPARAIKDEHLPF